MIITTSTTGTIESIHKTLTISTTLNERDTALVFQSHTEVQQNETITVKRNDNTVMFSGVVERVKLHNKDGGKVYTIRAIGLKKLFDMKRVAKTYEDKTAQEIVTEIVSEFCDGFTTTNVTGSVNIESAQFNYVKPSEAIRQIAESIGFSWYIDNAYDVHFFEKTTNSAPISITDDSDQFYDLTVEPDVRELANVILVRGGSYLSTTQTYEEVADGEKTQFILPEKPKDVTVEVDSGSGFVTKTIGTQFGDATATTEFQVNFQEKYIQNGTHATLASGDILKVTYKYDVPLRILRKDLDSIESLKLLFPSTDGEFWKVIEDNNVNSRELADEIAKENLTLYGNAKLNGQFKTQEHGFEVGQILTINFKTYSKDVVVTNVSARNRGGDIFDYTIKFTTVLFNFEDFLRTLLQRSKIEINDSEVVELINNVNDDVNVSDTVTVTVDQNRQNEDVTCADDAHVALNQAVTYVHAPYFPTSFTDPKRVMIHDYCPLHT